MLTSANRTCTFISRAIGRSSYSSSIPTTHTNGIKFGRALLMVRGSEGIASSINFYQNGLGMTVHRHTDEWAELSCNVGGNTDDSLLSFRLNRKGV